MKTLKFFKSMFIIGIVIFTFYIAMVVFAPDLKNFFNRVEFDRELWINWKETESIVSKRCNMIHNLTSEYELIGMTRSKVIELLVLPDDDFKFKNSIYYHLGRSDHGMDTGTLIIKFKDDKEKLLIITSGTVYYEKPSINRIQGM